MKKIVVIIALFVLGCTPQQEKISEAEVIKTVEGYFDVFHVGNDIPVILDEYVTEDFLHVVDGAKTNKKEFLDWIASIPYVKTDFELSDFKVTTDFNSAHTSLNNKWLLIIKTDSANVLQKSELLISVVLVKEEDKLKIKYVFADTIKSESELVE